MLFSLKFQRKKQQNALAMDSVNGKTGEKGGIFTVLWRWNNHIVRTEPMAKDWYSIWLCYRKWLMLFSLKLQRDNRQNALAVDPAKGKTGEKGCIFTALWRWNNHILWQSQTFWKGSIIRLWLFHLPNMGIRPFSPAFPLAGSIAEVFYHPSDYN